MGKHDFQLGQIHLSAGNTLDEQILLNEKKEIVDFEKTARVEKQPNKKFELFKKLEIYRFSFNLTNNHGGDYERRKI